MPNQQTLGSSSSAPSTSTIYINPRFRNAHINPNFLPRLMLPPQPPLPPQPTNIHINPLFLPAPRPQQAEVNFPRIHPVAVEVPLVTLVPKATIISQTSRKLVRQPVVPPIRIEKTSSVPSLVRIGKRKLVRAVNPSRTTPLGSSNVKESFKNISQVVRSRHSYKIDRRVAPTNNGIKRAPLHKSVHQLYENLASTRVIVADRRLLRIGTTPQKSVAQRPSIRATFPHKFELLNINGVFYKSTSNKLHRHPVQSASSAKAPTSERSVIVRGAKFHVDKGGKRLRRISETTTLAASTPSASLHRIHIGGMTYTEVTPNTFEQTDNHRIRVHLSAAKQKSINVLARNRTKNNVPCAIFRRLGKCRALDRNRCPKVHDPRHVAICPKFLQGSCPLDECLLSHNVTLAKMPTCKFFLAAICVRPNCPYLHKKVNDRTEICAQFVAGFCREAEKCPKRHEFLCPAFESKGVCDKIRCKLPHKAKGVKVPKTEERPESLASDETDDQKTDDRQAGDYQKEPKSSLVSDRYFGAGSSATVSDVSRGRIRRLVASYRAKQTETNSPANGSDGAEGGEDDVQQLIPSRPRLGTLPSFIPIE